MVFDSGDDDVLASLKVMEHRARGHSGTAADLACRGIPESEFDDRIEGRVENQLNRLGPALGVRAAGMGCIIAHQSQPCGRGGAPYPLRTVPDLTTRYPLETP